MSPTGLPLRGALVGAGLALCLGPAPAGGQGIPVTVGVGAIESGAGAFDLPVVLDMSARTELLGSFAVTVRWNPAVLQFQSGVDGTFGGITVNDDSLAAGVLHMAGVNPAGMGGLVTLGVGRFTVLSNDTTTFRVSVQELYAAATFADLTSDAVPLDRLFCGSLAGTWGDVTGDGAVNGADALVVLTESVGLDVSQFAIGFGDVDASGARNPRDALVILSFAVGIPTPTFRVGQSVGGNVCTPPDGQSYGINPATAEVLVGQAMNYFAFGLDAAGAALALRNVTWASSNAAVATIDGSGVASPVAPGTATITARQNDTTIASGTLTVLAGRATHWVDPLAVTARNQVGSAAHPFGDLQDAVSTAAAGDTVRIRAGRLPGGTIDRSLTLVGDTSAGGTRPVLTPPDPAAATPVALMLTTTATRVAIRDVQVDTARYGISAVGVDTVELRHVDVRAAGSALAAVHVDTAALVRLDQVRLFGRPTQVATSRGLAVGQVGTVAVDSSLVSDFAGHGIYAYLVDSVDVRSSTLRYNGDAGLWIATVDTARAARLVFSRNRVIQNQYYGVYGAYVRRASFDHNAFVGAGYYGDGIQLNGTRSGLLTLLADTIDVRGSDWLYVATMDSVLIDSLSAVTSDYGAYLYDPRVVVVRNSEFTAGYYEALYVDGRGQDSTALVVRNSRFSGLSTAGSYGYYDGYGVQVYDALADVRDSEFSDLYYGVEAAYGAVDVRHSTFDRVYYGVYNWCAEGDSRVDSTRIRQASYGVYVYGCSTAPAAVGLDSLDVQAGDFGAYVGDLVSARIRRSRFAGMYTAIEFYGTDTAVVDTSLLNPLYDGVFAYDDSVALFTGNTVDCSLDGVGLETYVGRRAVLRGNTVTGNCAIGVQVSYLDSAEVRGNTVAGSGDYAVYAYLDAAGEELHVVGNAITGPFRYGSIRADAADAQPTFLRLDSNTVASGIEAGIASYRGDSLLIRDNTVTGVKSGSCCLDYDGGIVIANSANSRKWVQVLRNRVTGATYGIRIERALADTLTAAVVDTNRIVGSDSIGIYVTGYSRVAGHHNTVDSTGIDGLRVDRLLAGDTLHVTFTNNNFTRSGQYGVNNLDAPGSIDARSNWWGDPNGPGNLETSGDFASSDVLYSPWLAAPAATLPPAPPAFLAAAPAARAPRAGGRAPAAPTMHEPRAAPPPPSSPPEGWDARVAERQRRQEIRIQQYRLHVERLAARAAERGARRGEERR